MLDCMCKSFNKPEFNSSLLQTAYMHLGELESYIMQPVREVSGYRQVQI